MSGQGQSIDMNAVRARIAYEQEHPEEAAALDASIRATRPSQAARIMVLSVQAAQQQGRTPAEIKAMPEFAAAQEAFPRLFRMVNDPTHSPELLNAMLSQLEAVEQGVKATHDASAYVGVRLANQFVFPPLGKPSMPLPE